MRVLSLFDGMSCGRVALERAGIKPSVYFASEIDKYAIKIAQKNFPDTIQLGDVVEVRKMAEMGFFGRVDLLIGGSPCQGFSFAGKQLAFDDPRSALFFEYVKTLEALRKTNPNIKFLLENVRMKKEHLQVIDDTLGVKGVCINSALVSAQNRVRYYWANWEIIQPADRGILLKDIIQWEYSEPESEGWHEWFEKNKDYQLGKKYSAVVNDEEKANTMTARQFASWNGNYLRLPPRAEKQIRTPKQKSRCMIASIHKGIENSGMTTLEFDQMKITGGAFRGRYLIDGVRQDHKMKTAGLTEQRLETREDGKSNCITSVQKDSLACFQVGMVGDIKGHDYNRRVYSPEGKCRTLNANSGGNLEPKVAVDQIFYRKLTPVECERLMSLKDDYTEGVSNSQRYKMCGNGWETATITHIFIEMLRSLCKQ
jgi:DNA (cytosine-5)-methyltransferase 3A